MWYLVISSHSRGNVALLVKSLLFWGEYHLDGYFGIFSYKNFWTFCKNIFDDILLAYSRGNSCIFPSLGRLCFTWVSVRREDKREIISPCGVRLLTKCNGIPRWRLRRIAIVQPTRSKIAALVVRVQRRSRRRGTVVYLQRIETVRTVLFDVECLPGD